jgi:hypothetical protein
MANALEMANHLRKKQEYQRALDNTYAYRNLCSDPDAYNVLGMIFRDTASLTGGINHSEHWLRRAVREKPCPAHEVNLGMTLLQQGKWREGWQYYAARKDVDRFRWSRARKGLPFWEGHSVEGRRILVIHEQGLGDMMQFARFIPRLKGRGASTVTVHCHPQLETLLRGASARLRIDKVIIDPEAGESYDLQVPQMSLPELLGVNGTAIQEVPYLVVPADTPLVIAPPKAEKGPRRVAIAWACNKDSDNHDIRSCPIAQFGPVAAAGFDLFSVQMEASGAEAAELDKLSIHNLQNELTSMARTAMVLQSVRALLTVDTAVAHLAGALNLDTVLMLHDAADWRWHSDKVTSSWYPSVRIVRQKRPGRWQDVITDAVAILRGLP